MFWEFGNNKFPSTGITEATLAHNTWSCYRHEQKLLYNTFSTAEMHPRCAVCNATVHNEPTARPRTAVCKLLAACVASDCVLQLIASTFLAELVCGFEVNILDSMHPGPTLAMTLAVVKG